MSIRQFRAVAPCLALDTVLRPAQRLPAIIEAAKGDRLAREPIDNNRDPLLALGNIGDLRTIEHKEPLQK